jgi:hypothetical protein
VGHDGYANAHASMVEKDIGKVVLGMDEAAPPRNKGGLEGALERFIGVGRGTQKYSWSDTGQELYRLWWDGVAKEAWVDFEAGSECIERAWNATWFGWDDGPRPFFWRWPPEYMEVMRDGLPIHIMGKTPRYEKPQPDEKNAETRDKVRAKLEKVRERQYIQKGFVESLTAFFSVPKGIDDIRIVYDGSVSGLNDVLWVPRSMLPSVHSHLRAVENGTFMAEVDIGEMFLNFMLHAGVRPFAGVDGSHYFPGETDERVWETWVQAAMGLTSSPYQFAEEMIFGDRHDPRNPYRRWDRIRLNLPGQRDYDPSLPWVSKVRKEDGRIARNLFSFVDDLRPTSTSKKEGWKAAQRAASILSYLGLQDASRKRRDSSQTPGAWAGAVIRSGEDHVYIVVSKEKWKRAKRLVEEVAEMIVATPTSMDRKRLEQIRGFLIYVVQTYREMTPYLIGLHMTIDFWRPNRDEEGWRVRPASDILLLHKNQESRREGPK